MAQGQLPLYYKNSKLVGSGTTKRRWTEYYLLLVTVFGFLILFAGVLWFVPSVEEDPNSYRRTYDVFTGSVTSDGTGPLSEPVHNVNTSTFLTLLKTRLHNGTTVWRNVSEVHPVPGDVLSEKPMVVDNSINKMRAQKVVQVSDITSLINMAACTWVLVCGCPYNSQQLKCGRLYT